MARSLPRTTAPVVRVPEPLRSSADRGRQLISIAQAAERLGVCGKTVRRRIADGSLTAYRVGPRLLKIDVADLDDVLRPIPTARRSA